MKSVFLLIATGLIVVVNSIAVSPLNRKLEGVWQIQFELSGAGEKKLTFESQPKGNGVIHLLDPAVERVAAMTTQPATWALNSGDRIDVSSQVEVQLGNCCRELGTIIFKGKFETDDLIKGRVIFIAATVDEENFNGYRSTVGTFTATRQPK
jgi:hypothetical protein